jgi:hypothetical protein
VSGAPLGTTETWPRALVGAALGTALAAVGAAVRSGAVDGEALAAGAVGEGVAAEAVGEGDAPWANAGTVPASTAVQASAMALRTVRRIESLSFVGPPGTAAG